MTAAIVVMEAAKEAKPVVSEERAARMAAERVAEKVVKRAVKRVVEKEAAVTAVERVAVRALA